VKILDMAQRSDEWFAYKRGKIGGTMLSDLYSKKGNRKVGFYELIAERLAVEPDDENRMDRGLRLEEDAMAAFIKETGKKVDLVGICVHDDYPEIINSPDGLIKNEGKYTEAVEIKCLSSARHLQVVVEEEIPDEFEAQKCQYFIVNPDLKTLYFVFYDDRILSVPLKIIKVTREELGDSLQKYLEFQIEQLKAVDEIVERLAF